MTREQASWEVLLAQVTGISDWDNLVLRLEAFTHEYQDVAPHPTTIGKWRRKVPPRLRGTSRDFVLAFARSYAGRSTAANEDYIALTRIIGKSRTPNRPTKTFDLKIPSDTAAGTLNRLKDPDALVGTYRSLRYKFGSTAPDKPLAVELLQVFFEDDDLRFYYHFRTQKEGVGIFRGDVRIFNRMLILAGTHEFTGDYTVSHRARVLFLHDERLTSPTYGRVRWGVVNSDRPDTSGGEPASARVLLEKFHPDTNVDPDQIVCFHDQEYIDRTYGIVRAEREESGQRIEKEINLGNWVRGLISNNIATAPANRRRGHEEDHVLRLSQETIDLVTHELLRKMDENH